MYCFVATNSTCTALLLLTQHVLWVSSNKEIDVELVTTKQYILRLKQQRNTCWVSSSKAIHVDLVVTKIHVELVLTRQCMLSQ
jgi:hypothetical protein